MKMKASILFLIGLFNLNFIIGQEVQNPKFQERLNTLLENNVPVYDVKSAFSECDDFLFLDARELEEYETSHIPNAKFVDYDKFDIADIPPVPKDKKVIVYCSVGYRSERIGEKLQEAGYDNVFNLYGGIFEWVNQDHEVIDGAGKPTETVHTYNQNWSQWLRKGTKVW